VADTSGNFLTKSVRPLTLIFLTLVVTILAITDGNIKFDDYIFTIDKDWVSLYKRSYITTIGAYFGGKSIERIKNKVVDK
jgi:hypothetical protein